MMVGTLSQLLAYLMTNMTGRHDADAQWPCFSCMSTLFTFHDSNDDAGGLNVWGEAQKFYRRPENFTNKCNTEHFSARDVRTRNCSDACVWISIENIIAAQVYRSHMRGCMSDLIKYNTTTMRHVAAYRSSQCVHLSLRNLFAQERGRELQYADQRVALCLCHSARCNGATSGHGRSGAAPLGAATMRLLLLFLATPILVQQGCIH